MRDYYSATGLRPFAGRLMLALLLLVVLGGCRASEPPLTPKAAAFKKEVQDCIDRLCQGLVEPIQTKDEKSITAALKNLEPDALKLCRMCPFRIGILDKTGETLSVYPYKAEAMGNFSNYDVVVQTLKNRQINQQRLFLQDGSQIYVICVPLIQGQDLVGLMVLSLSAEDAKQHWGLSEKEFLTLNFNAR